jgi:hypothetical protein
LICPACGGVYEYCHGLVVNPYFRHKEKEDCDRFPEPETEEHNLGKRKLYEWICKQDGVTDVVLEGWLPETRQRPDIMFKYNGEQHVIEYQCTPIATEYLERHNLYQSGGIKDWWILGIENYLNYAIPKDEKREYREKTIEKPFGIFLNPVCSRIFWNTENGHFDANRMSHVRKDELSTRDGYELSIFSDKYKLVTISLDALVFNGSFSTSEKCYSITKEEEIGLIISGIMDDCFPNLGDGNWRVSFSGSEIEIHIVYDMELCGEKVDLDISIDGASRSLDRYGLSLRIGDKIPGYIRWASSYDIIEYFENTCIQHICNAEDSYKMQKAQKEKERVENISSVENARKNLAFHFETPIFFISEKHPAMKSKFKYLRYFDCSPSYLKHFVNECNFLKRFNSKRYVFMVDSLYPSAQHTCQYFRDLGFDTVGTIGDLLELEQSEK